MSIIKVPAKLVEEIKYLHEEDVYDGIMEGLCSAFSWTADKIVYHSLDDDGDEQNDQTSCLINLTLCRKLVNLLMKAEIIEE